MTLVKAGLAACLFLYTLNSLGQEWSFNEQDAKAYALALNLQTEEAKKLIPDEKTAQEHYIMGLAETLELLITEDQEKFNAYEDHFNARIETKLKSHAADNLFAQAELRLQWAFVYLKFGHEFDAALNLRQAYQIAEECRQRYPRYEAIRKTSGLLQVMIGSVPEKYNWVLDLLGIEGSLQSGLEALQSIRSSTSVLRLEGDILYAMVQGFILQNTTAAVDELKKIQAEQPANKVILFLGASLALKDAQGQTAYEMLSRLSDIHTGLPIYYADYVKGEVYLQKGDYLNSISSYRWFISHYDGKNYIKDAYYKIALCYWLNGNVNDAHAAFKEARTKGIEETEADKHAARSLSEREFPHVKLSRARYFTDGGYMDLAKKAIDEINPGDLKSPRDQAEFYYRKARVLHKTKDIAAAKTFYSKTVEAGGDNWYFAPNSCLQLGYIALSENDKEAARLYFTKAIEYKKHEYKNSIDSKAKSALAQLKRK